MDVARQRPPNAGRDTTGQCSPNTIAAPGISLVLPAYNNEQTIEQAIGEAAAALSSLTADFEILVIDDGSSDHTAELAGAAARQHAAVRVISHDRHRGYDAALRTGFQAAAKPLIGISDAGCQYHPAELERLVMLARHHDVVCGYRMDRQDRWPGRVLSQGYNALAQLLLGTGVRDSDCALKIFRREVLQELSIDTRGYLSHAELLAKARLNGKSVVDVGVTHRPGAGGASHAAVFETLRKLAALVRFWWTFMLFPQSTAELVPAAGPRDRVAWPVSAACLLALCLLAAVTLLANLSYPLIEPDESRNAQIALEMFRSGDLLAPTRLGEPYLDKPPLLSWLITASYTWLGVSEFSTRLPVALASLMTVMLTYELGRRLIGRRGAWIGALVMLLCVGFVMMGRFVVTDGLLTLFTTTCSLSCYLAVMGHRFRWPWWLAGAAACGLGVLTKGPVSVILCVPPLVATLWLTPDMVQPRLRHWLAFIGLVVAVAAPWYLAIATREPEFIGYFFWKHNVQRFVSGFNHHAPAWFYIPVVLLGLLPCSLLLPAAVVFLTSRTAGLRRQRTRELGFLVLAAVWVVAFFSASSAKLPTYILPSVPMLCLLLGRFIDRVLLSDSSLPALFSLPFMQGAAERFPKHVTVVFLCLGVVTGVADVCLSDNSVLHQLLTWSVVLAAVALMLLASRVWFSGSNRQWVLAAGVCLCVTAYAYNDVFPEGVRIRSRLYYAASEIHKLRQRPDNRDVPVVFFGALSDGAPFYAGQQNVSAFDESQVPELCDFADDHPRLLLATIPKQAQNLRDDLPPDLELTELGGEGLLYQLQRREFARPSTAQRRASSRR